jgi:putative ABC transport system permease protein
MLFGETIQVAFEALQANKLRSFLTMLGIVIGVAAVIAMVALGRGASESVKARIASLGTTLLTVTPGQARGGGGPVASATDRAPLTLDDATAIANRAQYVLAVQPEMARSLQVQYESRNTNTNIVGTTANYLDVRNFKLADGRMFGDADDNARRVAVLGPQVVSDLGVATGAALVGETVRIDGVQFEVIGVLESKGAGGFRTPTTRC